MKGCFRCIRFIVSSVLVKVLPGNSIPEMTYFV